MKRQTAANNETLRRIKRLFNGKIYQRCLHLMNDAGPKCVRDYLGQFYRDECREQCLDEIFGRTNA